MKNLLIALAVLVILGVGLSYLLPDRTDDVVEDPFGGEAHAAYFQERMITLGVEDIGQPIEGFDASLLIMAFPGLTPQDFEGVETLEGRYEVTNGEIAFVRDVEMPVTSAERMVSDEGYETLLRNLATRFEVNVESEATVDTIINTINTGERIEARIDEGGSALGVKVVPLEVLEDSRCPIDAQCIQAGTVRVRATLSSGLGEADQVFELDAPITTEAETVTLVQVSPAPEAGVEIDDSEYQFVFEVKKRELRDDDAQ